MAYASLRACITDLERTGQLVRIEQEIDPYLEAAEIQRRVYQALGDRMREQIHALSMKTLTPAEWAASPQPAATHHH